MNIGIATPPPGTGGTNPDGSIDTPATEAPAPWTPPAHWPPMPDGLTPAQVADWIARNRLADASAAHATAQDRTAAAMETLVTEQRLAREALNAPPTFNRHDLAWRAFMSLPQVTGYTELNMVDKAYAAADAFLKRTSA